MFQKLFFIIIVIIVSSCSRDELTCDCIEKNNKLCREVVFTNNKYSGYIQYFYTDFDSLKTIVYSSNSSNNNKNIYFYYDSLNIIQRKSFLNSNTTYNEQRFTFIYNRFNEIFFLSNNDTISKHKYYYENNFLKKIEYISSSIDSSTTWDYYSDNKIRFEKHRNANNNIKNYKFFEYFSNGYEKISHYDINDSLIEYYTIKKDNNKTLEISCTKSGKTYIYENSEYFDNGNIKKKISFNENGNELVRIHYLYNNLN